jgi:hypothetical protein
MKLADDKNSAAPYQVTLSGGRVVAFRQMVASDLIFMERQERDVDKSATERTIAMIERLSSGAAKITQPEIKKLSLKDFGLLADLMNQAGGLDEDVADEDSEDED